MFEFELSVVVPALNEERTISEVIDRLLALPFSTQIIVVNDGSTDGTAAILESYGNKIEVITNEKPSGKGNAIRKALPRIKGLATIIQDADLEYESSEIPSLITPIIEGREKVVFGTRFANGLPKNMALPNKVVNVLLAMNVRVLYGVKITDEATCYKAMRSDVLQAMELECQRFEFCPEVTSKAIRLGCYIAEVPISYTPRSKNQGKKIRWTDAPEAFSTLFKYRFWRSSKELLDDKVVKQAATAFLR